MTEWRRKRYYRTRVLIPVDECLDSAFGDCLVCLTGGQLNLIRNLLLYAERRSTFVSEYHEGYYLAPTVSEWDDLQSMVSDLEGNLMDCEQFTEDLQEILDWVRTTGSLTEPPFTEAEQEAFPYDGVVGDDELTPAEEDACDVAQLWFEWGYQIITEQVLPATRWGFDYLVPAVAGFIALAIGGPPAAMGVYAVAEFIQELLEIAYRGAETNLVNWLDTNKSDIVCVLYSGLQVGGDASTIWNLAYGSVVSPAEDISAGDKLMLSLFMGSWAGSNAIRAFDAETQWAGDNVIAGYCDECGKVELPQGYWMEPATYVNWEVQDEGAVHQTGELHGASLLRVDGMEDGLYEYLAWVDCQMNLPEHRTAVLLSLSSTGKVSSKQLAATDVGYGGNMEGDAMINHSPSVPINGTVLFQNVYLPQEVLDAINADTEHGGCTLGGVIAQRCLVGEDGTQEEVWQHDIGMQWVCKET